LLEPEWVSADKEISDEGLSELEHDDLKEKIERFVATLPDRQKVIMTMRMHGATTDEIIEATGLSVENIRTILSRTRQQVRDFYNKINK
jgi:RNA polymerase sigma factor (sigma-70 family)